jgi:hypothetical protein
MFVLMIVKLRVDLEDESFSIHRVAAMMEGARSAEPEQSRAAGHVQLLGFQARVRSTGAGTKSGGFGLLGIQRRVTLVK